MERGIVFAGSVLPDSDFVLRDPKAFWSWSVSADRPDLRQRGKSKTTLIVGHWTAGPARTGPRTALSVVRSMKARKRGDGSLADVSCHFVIGWDGLVWQVADLAWATVHAGRAVNLNSIGVETAWPGTEKQAMKIARTLARLGSYHTAPTTPIDVRTVRGSKISALRPAPALVQGFVRLSEFLVGLAASHPELNIVIPRELDLTGTPKHGACEHQHVPGTTKVDAAGYLMDGLRAAGWS